MAEMAVSAISAITPIEQYKFLNVMEIFDGIDADPTEAKTGSGHSIWLQADPVHLAQPAYKQLAEAISAMAPLDDDSLLPRKRVRLESVVPPAPGGSRGHQGRIRPPLWVSGMATRGRGEGRGRGRGPYGGQPRGGHWLPRGRGNLWGYRPYGSARAGGSRRSRGRF